MTRSLRLWVCFALIATSVSAFAQPVKIAFSPDGFPAGTSKEYPGGGSASGKSDLTADEAKMVIDKLNKCFSDAIGAGMVEVVPLKDNPDVPRKLFVSGGDPGLRGQTSSANKETFVFAGSLADKEPAKSDRAKLVNAIVFAAKHELLHLLGGLEDSDHGCEFTQVEKDRQVAEMEQFIADQKAEVATQTGDMKTRNEEIIKRNEKVLAELKAMPVLPANTFTKGENVSSTEISDPANLTISDPVKEALKKGIQNIINGKEAKGDASTPGPGKLTPLRGPLGVDPIGYTDAHADYLYAIQHSLIGRDPLNSGLSLGLFSDGDYIPFAQGAPNGFITLEANQPYEFVLADAFTGQFYPTTGANAQISFNPLLTFPGSSANTFGDTLTGPYYGEVFLNFDLTGDGTSDSQITLTAHRPFAFSGGDGFAPSLSLTSNPNAMINSIPAPKSVILAGFALAGLMLWRLRGREVFFEV